MTEEPTIWRCISWKNVSGGMNWYARKYMYDDLVSTDSLIRYIKQIEFDGVENIKLQKLGPMSYVVEKNLHPEPRAGTKRLSRVVKNNHKLEEYQ